MLKEPFTVSVVVNNYNYARFLPAAIESVLPQLRQGDELVIVDDGSTDESSAILAGFADRGSVRVIKQRNQGQLRTVLVNPK